MLLFKLDIEAGNLSSTGPAGSGSTLQKGGIVMAKFIVTSEERDEVDRQMCEIKRQLRQKKGSPLDPKFVKSILQDIIDGRAEKEEIGTVKMFDPHAYFKIRRGLWFAGSFEGRILLKQQGLMPYRGFVGVASDTLDRSMSDHEILDEFLGGIEEARKHAFSLDQIATLIESFQNGVNHVILFHFWVGEELLWASLSFNFDSHTWIIRGWSLGERERWESGTEILRNTILTT